MDVSSKLNWAKQDATGVSAFHSMIGLIVRASAHTMVRKIDTELNHMQATYQIS